MRFFVKRGCHSLRSLFTFRSMSAKKEHLDVTSGQFRHEVTSPAVVVDMTYISPTVRSLTMKVEDKAFGFYAGQWVDFMVPGTSLVGGYSMCSSPGQLRDTSTLQLAVKKSLWPPAVWVHNQCSVGSGVTLKAGGNFFFRPRPCDRARPLLLVAGGVGINPLMSILLHCRDLREAARAAHAGYSPGQIALLYSARSRDELLFKEKIFSMEKDRLVTPRLFVTGNSDSIAENAYNNRRVTFGDLERAVQDLGGDPLCYLCGPSAMIADVERWLVQLGVPQTSVLYERWW